MRDIAEQVAEALVKARDEVCRTIHVSHLHEVLIGFDIAAEAAHEAVIGAHGALPPREEIQQAVINLVNDGRIGFISVKHAYVIADAVLALSVGRLP